jgi:hypothetical protein
VGLQPCCVVLQDFPACLCHLVAQHNRRRLGLCVRLQLVVCLDLSAEGCVLIRHSSVPDAQTLRLPGRRCTRLMHTLCAESLLAGPHPRVLPHALYALCYEHTKLSLWCCSAITVGACEHGFAAQPPAGAPVRCMLSTSLIAVCLLTDSDCLDMRHIPQTWPCFVHASLRCITSTPACCRPATILIASLDVCCGPRAAVFFSLVSLGASWALPHARLRACPAVASVHPIAALHWPTVGAPPRIHAGLLSWGASLTRAVETVYLRRKPVSRVCVLAECGTGAV